jgi:hypothetical protein
MGVLAMLEIDGDAEQLMNASAEIDRRLPTPAGLLVRMAAPPETGIVLFQLWESAAARTRNAEDPAHAEALEASGMQKLMRGTRSRVFEDTELRRVAAADALS